MKNSLGILLRINTVRDGPQFTGNLRQANRITVYVCVYWWESTTSPSVYFPPSIEFAYISISRILFLVIKMMLMLKLDKIWLHGETETDNSINSATKFEKSSSRYECRHVNSIEKSILPLQIDSIITSILAVNILRARNQQSCLET